MQLSKCLKLYLALSFSYSSLEFVLHSILSTVYSHYGFTVILLKIMTHCGLILFLSAFTQYTE